MKTVGCVSHAQGTPRADEFGKMPLKIRKILLKNKCATAACVCYYLKNLGFVRAEQKTIIEERHVLRVQFKSSCCSVLCATA